MSLQIDESSQPVEVENSMSRIHWRIIVGLAGANLVLLWAVHFLPFLIGRRDASFRIWSAIAHGSLNFAQFQLLAVFWAIARCNWLKRTMLFSIGVIVLSLMLVAIMYLKSKNYTGPNLTWFLFLNTVDVFWGEMFVLAILIDSFRPLWGTLSRAPSKTRDQTSIYSILRTTMLSAFAAMVLKNSGAFQGGGLSSITWFCISAIVQTALLASCIWLAFAKKHNWIGVVGLLVTIVVGVMSAHPNLIRNGYWQHSTFLLVRALWLLATFSVVRYFGFRLQEYQVRNAEPSTSTPTTSRVTRCEPL